MKPVLVLPLNTPALDCKRAEDEGYLVIKARDPSKVAVKVPSVPTAAVNDLLMAALTGIAKGDATARGGFFFELHRRLTTREMKADAVIAETVTRSTAGGAS